MTGCHSCIHDTLMPICFFVWIFFYTVFHARTSTTNRSITVTYSPILKKRVSLSLVATSSRHLVYVTVKSSYELVHWDYRKALCTILTKNSFFILDPGLCGFRPFDFDSKLKIENKKFTIVIFNVWFLKNWKSQIYNLNCQFLFLRNIKLKNNFQCFENQKLKIENGQLVVFISCF